MLQTHLKRLRAIKIYQRAQIYVFIEANFGGWWASDVVRNVVEQKDYMPLEVCSYDETDKDRAGIWMTDEVKRCMAGEFSRSLADGQLCFAKEFSCGSSQTKAMQAELLEQLSHYREQIIAPNDEATGKFKKITTGKSSGRKDDLCICAQIALFFSSKKRLEPEFRTLAEHHGWRY